MIDVDSDNIAKVDNRKFAFLAAIISAVFVLYASISGYFQIGLLSDDSLNLLSAVNTTFMEKFLGRMPDYSAFHYRPIWFLSIEAEHFITKALSLPDNSALVQRTVNLLLFTILAFLAGKLVLRFTGKTLLSTLAVAAILFYPNNLNSICWTIGLVDLLAGIFMIVSVSFALRYILDLDTSKRFLYLSLLALALGLLTKETTVAVPLLVMLISFFKPSASWQKAVNTAIASAIVVLLYILLRFVLQGSSMLSAFSAYSDGGLAGRLKVIVQAVVSIVFPFDYLSLQNGLTESDTLMILYSLGISFFVVMLFISYRKSFSGKQILFFAGIFLSAILPNMLAGYFRSQLVLIPFVFSTLPVFIVIGLSDVRTHFIKLSTAVIFVFWLIIGSGVFRDWIAADNASYTSLKQIAILNEETVSSSLIIGLPGRIGQAHSMEYASGAYNIAVSGTLPAKTAVNDAVHISATDTESLNSPLNIVQISENEFVMETTGATQYFQITGSRRDTIFSCGYNIRLTGPNNFNKPCRLELTRISGNSQVFVYSNSILSGLQF